jgi:hypothetical protein
LTMFGFNTAIQCGEEWDIDNADQLRIDDLRTFYCFTGIRLVTNQSLSHHIGNYEGAHVFKMLVAEKGGKVTGDNWTLETPGATLVESWTPQGAESGYTFLNVTLDGNADENCIIWNQLYTTTNPATGLAGTGGAETMTIVKLHCHPGYVYEDAFRVGKWATVTVLSGVGLSASMWRPTGGIETHKPIGFFYNCEIDIEDPLEFVSSNASGAYALHIINCHSPGGVKIPSRSWTKDQAGVITIHGPEMFANTYTVTGGSTDRALNAGSATLADTTNVLATLITDLKAAGVIPAA